MVAVSTSLHSQGPQLSVHISKEIVRLKVFTLPLTLFGNHMCFVCPKKNNSLPLETLGFASCSVVLESILLWTLKRPLKLAGEMVPMLLH